MTDPSRRCQRPWWKRPPVWLVAVILLGAVGYVVTKETGRPAPMPYGEFLDQLKAGNVASATFKGTEVVQNAIRHVLHQGR